jgi:hypothetical protein
MRFIYSYFTIALLLISTFSKAQTHSIILGRPTDTSITASILFDQNVQFYLAYGIQIGTFTDSTIVYNNVMDVPDEIDLINLQPNTRYYYQLRYKLTTASTYTSTPEYKFLG